MTIRLFSSLFAFGILFSQLAFGQFDHSHKAWTQILGPNVSPDGFVYYKSLHADYKADKNHPLKHYLKSLSAVSHTEFKGWNRNQQMAFLINAYNAFTIQLILDNYPIKSIRKLGGLFGSPWGMKFFKLLGGEIKTLDEIEHDWLRPKYKDARIHAAVNCASFSCPILQPQAFTASGLDKELEDAFVAWIKDPVRNQFTEKSIRVSEIFDWFEEDFVHSYGSVKKTLEKYAPAIGKKALAQGVKIKELDYKWTLNEAMKKQSASEKKRNLSQKP